MSPIPEQRTSALTRYAPPLAIAVVIAVAIGVLSMTGRDPSASGPADRATSGPVDANAAPSSSPLTYDQARAEGKAESITWVDNCDPKTGRLMIPTQYAPPCVARFDGNNGGSTSPGVDAEKITLVLYIGKANNDLSALLEGKGDDPEATDATSAAYLKMLDDLYETYGRRIEIVALEASGDAGDVVAARADAAKVADDIKAFGSIGGPGLTTAYAEALAARQILCFGCGGTSPDSFYQEHQPFIWGGLATPEQFLTNLQDFIAKQLVGRPAAFAGDELRSKTRTFGVVHFELNPPVFGVIDEQIASEGRRGGMVPALTETYAFDMGTMPERATTIVAKLKSEGVTSVVFMGDPIMPLFLTRAATAQNYEPEWIISGTAGTDLTLAGRFYDQVQWRHAFGISSLGARLPAEQGDAHRLHQWYFGDAPAAANTAALIYGPLQQIFAGIHSAGPNLTPETFKLGMFAAPPSGGGPTAPHVSFGDRGLFRLADGQPRTDFLGIDDVTLIWWDAAATGPDEQGKVGTGMWRYVDRGKRYLPGAIPEGEPRLFDTESTVTMFEEPPPEDRWPEYPPLRRQH